MFCLRYKVIDEVQVEKTPRSSSGRRILLGFCWQKPVEEFNQLKLMMLYILTD
jgi:hypothetical protein